MHDVTSVMSDSLRPRGLQPARLLCPWDSPGKNTGVGCHAPGELPNPGIEPAPLTSPALAGRFFTTSITPRKPFTILEDVKDNLTILTVLIHLFASPCL